MRVPSPPVPPLPKGEGYSLSLREFHVNGMQKMTLHITLHKRYLLWLFFFAGITMLPAIALNWVLLSNEGDVQAMSFEASDWQQQTHGITFTPTLGNNGFFKTLRLNDRLPEIDTVIFGASTAMTIDSSMLPQQWHLYNFTQSGSPLRDSIAQAEYLEKNAPQLKQYIIMLDWGIDYIYEPDTINPADLSRADRKKILSQKPGHSFMSMLQESVSYPRMVKLWQVLSSVAHAPNPQNAFREYFRQIGSDQYTCPDGKSPGKDFGVYNRGACNGFRYDGSATFSDYTRVESASRTIVGALASSSMYSHALQHTKGVPDPVLFERLAALNTRLVAHGGKLILLVPPLIPGLEQAFMAHPQLSVYLKRTQHDLNLWASQHSVTLADFSQSEKFGCTADEFLDAHHATKTCYQKIFADFWQNVGADTNTH